MPKKYKALLHPRQLRYGVVLVDKSGNKRKVIKWIDNNRVLLTHKNSDEPGSVHSFDHLLKTGDIIRQ